SSQHATPDRFHALSLHDALPILADGHGMSALGRSWVAGQLKYMRELTLLLAPNINSYKRFVEGSFAPTALRWGRDNRTCAFRLRSEEHTSELQSRENLVCRLLLE